MHQWRLDSSHDSFSLTGWHGPTQWRSATESEPLICLLRNLISTKGSGALQFSEESRGTVTCELCPKSVIWTVEIVIGYTIRNPDTRFTFVAGDLPNTVVVFGVSCDSLCDYRIVVTQQVCHD